jgi:hypothetical protein
MTTYTVLAYREDAVDTCRGCVMDRSSSAFEVKCFQSNDEAIKYWAEKRYADTTSERHLASWELTLLVDGLDRDSWWDVNSQAYDAGLVDEPAFYGMDSLSEPYLQELRVEAAERVRIVSEEKAAKAAEARRVAAIEEGRKELAEFTRLSAKFGAVVPPAGTSA